MNKITIPIILTVTVMIAGLFAFVPVQQASTVHSASLIESNVSSIGQALLVVSDSGTGITDGDTVIIDCDVDFIINDMYWEIDDYDGSDEQLQIGDGTTFITIDGVALIGADDDSSTQFDLINPTGNAADNVNVKISWASVMTDLLIQTGGQFYIPPQLWAVGADANDIVITIEDNGTSTFDADDTLTVTALIQTQSNADCSVDVNT